MTVAARPASTVVRVSGAPEHLFGILTFAVQDRQRGPRMEAPVVRPGRWVGAASISVVRYRTPALRRQSWIYSVRIEDENVLTYVAVRNMQGSRVQPSGAGHV
jgi:hypothetical protein